MRHSIRFRLQVWHGLMLALVLTAFGVTAYETAWQDRLQAVDDELDAELQEVLRSQGEGLRQRPGRPPEGPPPGGPRPGGPRRDDAFVEEIKGEIGRNIAAMERRGRAARSASYYLFLDYDGTVLARSTNAPAGVPLPTAARPPGGGSALIPLGQESVQARTRQRWREVYRVLPLGDAVIVGRSLEVEAAALRNRLLLFAGAGLALLGAGLAGGWWLTGRALRPLQTISETAANIAQGDLSHRIPAAETESELGQLADVLNGTFARLEESFARQARFTSDASHELRTPISVILSKTQMTLARERTPAEYQEALRACQRAAQRMRGLTESLLALSRQEAGVESLAQEPVDLAAVARETVAMFEPLMQERGLKLESLLEPAVVTGDSVRLAQVMANLLSNALQFSPAGGVVTVTTRTEGDSVRLEVQDAGHGIAPVDLPHIFERFYRADRSRTGAGNSGLGLAIVRSVVEAHGGSVAAESELGRGARFIVTMPSLHRPA